MGSAKLFAWTLVLGATLLASCSGGDKSEAEINRLAAEIDRTVKNDLAMRGKAGFGQILSSTVSIRVGADRALVVRQSLCDLTGPKACRPGARKEWRDVEFVIPSADIDAASIRVDETGKIAYKDHTLTAGKAPVVLIACQSGTGCISVSGGANADASTIALRWLNILTEYEAPVPETGPLAIGCKVAADCERVAADLKALIDLAQKSRIASAGNIPAECDKMCAHVEKIEHAAKGAQAVRGAQGVTQIINRVDAVALDETVLAGRLSFCEMINDCENRNANDWGTIDLRLDLAAADAGTVVIVTPPEGNGEGRFVAVACRTGASCVSARESAGTSTFSFSYGEIIAGRWSRKAFDRTDGGATIATAPFALACPGAEECGVLAESLKQLIALALPSADANTDNAAPVTEADFKAAADRLLAAFDDGGYEGKYGKKEEVVLILQPRRIRLADHHLSIDYARCSAASAPETCVLNPTRPAKTMRTLLRGFKDALINPAGYEIDLSPGRVTMACFPGKTCIRAEFDVAPLERYYWRNTESFACAGAEDCMRLRGNLAAIVAWGIDHPYAAFTVERPAGSPFNQPTPISNVSPPDKESKPCFGLDCMDVTDKDIKAIAAKERKEKTSRFAELISSASADIAVDGGTALRRMSVGGATLDANGALIVNRFVCKALLAPHVDQSKECRAAGLDQAYNLRIDLKQVRPQSVRIKTGESILGEAGAWITADCADFGPCAVFAGAKPPKPLAASIGDDPVPWIRIPCNSKSCPEAAEILKSLAGGSGAPAPQPEPQSETIVSAADILTRLNQRMRGAHYSGPLGEEGDQENFNIDLIVDQVAVEPGFIVIRNVNCGREPQRCQQPGFNKWASPSTLRIPATVANAAKLGSAVPSEKAPSPYKAFMLYEGEFKFDVKPRWLLFFCVTLADCQRNRDDLLALIGLAGAPGFVPPSPAAKAPEIAGLWELYVPAGGSFSRWMLEFGADGKYKFTDTSNGASHQGAYTAQNGKWSLDGFWSNGAGLPPGTNIVFADQGTYRLLSGDALEFVGQLGPAVWKKVGVP